jgi:hypothetical protein
VSDRSLGISQLSPCPNAAPRPVRARADATEIVRLGTLYLRIGGSFYASAGGGLIALCWLDRGAVEVFAAVVAGFCAYAAVTAWAALTVKAPAVSL